MMSITRSSSSSPEEGALRRNTARPLLVGASRANRRRAHQPHEARTVRLHDPLQPQTGVPALWPMVAGVGSPEASPTGFGPAVAEANAADKTVFDVKVEKFDAAAKITIIKEVRSFTDLGLKEAKDLVEKAPVVVKKGVTKEEADTIIEKLKALGATVVLE